MGSSILGNSDWLLVGDLADGVDAELDSLNAVPPPQHVDVVLGDPMPDEPCRVTCWSCYAHIETCDVVEAVVFRLRHDRLHQFATSCRHPKVSVSRDGGLTTLACVNPVCGVMIGTWLAPGAGQL